MLENRRIVIIGGVAAGASAATRARRVDEEVEIVILEKGDYVSWANCGLPYYLGGDIRRRSNLLLVSPELFWDRFRVDVRTNSEAVEIDRGGKRVRVLQSPGEADLRESEGPGAQAREAGEYWISYDKLIIATGGAPITPPLPGIDRDGVFTLTTIPDADAAYEYLGLNERKPSARRPGLERAVVVGGGFIGIETAEALHNRGYKVTLVELANQVLPPFDPEMAGIISEHLKEVGIGVILGDGVAAFRGEGERGPVRAIDLQSGKTIPADVVIQAIGVAPRIGLARAAGLEIGEAGGVVVNARMQTSDPEIYAAGDIVESLDLVTGKRVRMPLAGPANKQGRAAGTNAAGGDLEFRGVLGTSIVKACQLTGGRTGLSEKDAAASGIDCFVSYTHNADHAGYYPGAENIAIKAVVERDTGRLLGIQAVGKRGVDKRIDVAATAIQAGMTVEDLEHLDLAYAPPFGAAKDPIIIAGMTAANIKRGAVAHITPQELASGNNFQVLDVRTEREYRAGHIKGAVNVPLHDLRDRIDDIRRLVGDGEIVVNCRVGYRSYHACRILKHHGLRPLNLSGGYRQWVATFPEEG